MDQDARWTAVATAWSRLWAGAFAPVHAVLAAETGVGPGTTVLDVGCGSGELLEALAARGAVVAGVDPARGMVALARERVPDADVRVGTASSLPWATPRFDVVTVVNALQFEPDPVAAVSSLARVVQPGGAIAVAIWADAARNDLDVVEARVAEARSQPIGSGGPLRESGALAEVLTAADLDDVRNGVAELLWTPDADGLVDGVLLEEDAATRAACRELVLEAAAPYRYQGEASESARYRLRNEIRWAVSRRPAGRSTPAPSR